MKKHLPLLGLLLCIATSVFAQNRTVSGTVTDGKSGETLPAVNVYVKGDISVGSATDFDGKYSIEVPANAEVLVFQSVGYETQERDIPAGSTIINVEMSDASVGLNTVVVSASKRSEKILDAPASVTVIGRDKIEAQVALSPVDHLKKAPGVDIMQTGLTSSNVSIRGFNGVFSGSVLNIVDDRIARVPSLKVNAYQLIPVNTADVERIEVIRGPGSALYGPNAADGVLSIVTRSPLDLEVGEYETNISMGVGLKSNSDTLLDINPFTLDTNFRSWTFGERILYTPEFRHSGRVSEKFGYKISLQYQKGNDWVYYDPREPKPGVDSVVFGTVQNGEIFQITDSVPQVYNRDFSVDKIAGEARFDYAPSEDWLIIGNLGYTRGTNIEPTGLGAGQAIDWTYLYGQARVSYKDLFLQYFVNSSDANDTYLIPQSGPNNPGSPPIGVQSLIDISKLHAFSVQHRAAPVEGLQLTYGADALLTRPNTEGSINGRFENADNINQYGAYLQGEYKFNDKWKAVAAGRVDYHDPLDQFNYSPRAALVYKPAPKHTLRATYNRAFNTPSVLNIALDLSNGLIPNGINVRGVGNPSGYDYFRDDMGLAQMLNPYNGMYYNPTVNDNNLLFWNQFQGALGALLADGAGLPPAIFDLVLSEIYSGLPGQVGDIDLLAIDYANVASGIGDGSSDPRNQFDIGQLQDFEEVRSELTQTYEIGYKGLLANDRLFLNVDLYATTKINPRTGLETVAPSIIFDSEQLAAILGPNEAGGLLYDNLAAFEANSADLYATLVASLDGQGFGSSTPNGSIWDEFVVLTVGGNEQLTLGTVAPLLPGDSSLVGADAILTYRNLDTSYTVFGTDIGFTFLATDDISVSGSLSYISRDSIPVPAAAGGFVSLNAPKFRFSLGYDQNIPRIGISLGATFRYSAGFYANDAIYVGDVAPYNVLDARISYQPKWSENTRFVCDVSNVTGKKYRTYPNIPAIGRLTMFKVQHTF